MPPYPLPGKLMKIMFAFSFLQGILGTVSHISFVDLKNGEIDQLPRKTVLSPGGIGAFDQHGVSPCCVIEVDGNLWLYYLGWNRGVDVPFRNSIGLAVWNEEKEIFEKMFEGPILDRNPIDPYSLSYPFVIHENGAFRMWYGSHLHWGKEDQNMQHVIKHATSQDGIHWDRQGHICIDVTEDDFAFSRPWLQIKEGKYEMYYCCRGGSYRLAYASSLDGLSWQKHEDWQIQDNLPLWAIEMQCYPALATWNGQRHLLFNGNNFGKTGFGVIEEIEKMRK